jgi:hypothetical protein
VRTLTAQELLIYQTDKYSVFKRVWVKKPTQTWVQARNLADDNGYDWIKSIDYDDNIDQPVAGATINLWRRIYWLNNAPLMTSSKMNLDSIGTFSALLDMNYDIKIETATIPEGTLPTASDWRNVFEGKLDDPQWGGQESNITLSCRDLGAVLQQIFIETEDEYGADDGSVLAEDVIQALLNRWAPGVTLYCPVASGWAIHLYKQEKKSLMEAIQDVAMQKGAWNCHYKYDEGTSAWRLTFYEPIRNKSVADYTWSPGFYFAPTQISLGGWAKLRTVIGGRYKSFADGKTYYLTYPETGTATAGGASTLTDSSKSWTTNKWQTNYDLWITSGTGAGQHKNIVSNTGTQITVTGTWTTNPDATSVYAIVHKDDSAQPIINYGRLYMELTEDANSQVDTEAEMFNMCRSCFNDVSRPGAEQELPVRYFYAAERGDLYTFIKNEDWHDTDQTWAVVGARHHLSGDKAETIFTTRGKPSGAYMGWYRRGAYSGVAPFVVVEPPPTPVTTVTSIPRGARIEILA